MTHSLHPATPAVATALCCALCASTISVAAEGQRRNYNLPAGDAAATLKQFAADSGEQIVYLVDNVRGEKTNRVAGVFPAREALERMLAGTRLVASQDPATGALVVGRRRTVSEEKPTKLPPRRETPAPAPKAGAMTENKSLLARLAAALALLATPVAQGAETKADKPAEAIRLSPFTVSTEKDTGYIAADTLTGGLLATNLLKTATDVSVLTRDFLDDIGATNLQEAQLWLTSSDIGGSSALATNPTDFGVGASFRGLASNGNMRNYFRHAFTPEEYVVERIEGSRGPNGILYGDAFQGGKANFLTKRASFARDFTQTKVRFDTFGQDVGRGVQLDVNRRLRPNWAARVNFQLKKGPQWYDHSFDDRRGFAVATTYKPWQGAELRFEGEKNVVRTSNYRPDAFTDGNSLWDRTTTVSGPVTANPGGGVVRLATNNWVYIQGVGVQNWINFGKSTGTGLTLFPTAEVEGRQNVRNFGAVPSRRFNINSFSDRNEAHNADYNLALEQTFDSGLVVEVAGDYNHGIRHGNTLYYLGSFIDVNRVLPDGRPNPNFGKIFSEQNFNTNPIRTADYYAGARVAAAYPLRFAKFSQTFSVVAQYREHTASFKSWQYFRDNGNLAPTGLVNNALDQNQSVRIWRYWDAAGGDVALPESDGANRYRWVASRDRHLTEHLGSIQINTIGSYFRDTLTFIGGVRRDAYHGADRDIARRDPVTGAATFSTGLATDADVDTTSMGLTYFPIKAVGVYAFQNRGFQPALTNTPKLDGTGPYNLAQSEGHGAGLRFNFLGGRVVGSVGYYDSFETDRVTALNLTLINDVWDAVIAAGGPNRRVPQTGVFVSYADSLSQRSWGWEGDITANVSRALRLTFNVALPETKQSRSLRDTKDYYAGAIETWQQYYGNATVRSRLDTLTNFISSFTDGRPLNGLYDYRVNGFANYTVQSGPLKNVRVGGGANVFGRQIIQNKTGRPFDFIYGDAFVLVSASLGYNWKIREYPLSVQLNVSNLLDYDEPVFRQGGVATVGGVQYRQNYYWLPPRQWKLTTTLRF